MEIRKVQSKDKKVTSEQKVNRMTNKPKSKKNTKIKLQYTLSTIEKELREYKKRR